MLRTENLPSPDDLSWIEDLGTEEPSDLFRVYPELRPSVDVTSSDGELGLRSLLESPATRALHLREARGQRAVGPRARRRGHASRLKTP
jgi:hypothetical protein